MPPKSKKPPVKVIPQNDWSWVYEVQDPSVDLTQEHIERAIGLTTAQNCPNNYLPVVEKDDQKDSDDEQDADANQEDDDAGQSLESGSGPNAKSSKRSSSSRAAVSLVSSTLMVPRKKKRPALHRLGGAATKNKWQGGACMAMKCRKNLLCTNHLGAKRVSPTCYNESRGGWTIDND